MSKNPSLIFWLLVVASFYNGPGHSLHWLTLCALFLLIWVSRSLWRQDLSYLQFSWGLLPALAFVYLGWLAVSLLLSTYPYASWVQAAGLAILPLTMLGWLLQPDTDKEKAWIPTWRWLMICGLILAVWGIIDLALLRQRAHGPLIDANAYAALINLFLVPSAFAYLTASNNQKGWYSSHWLLTVVAVLALALAMTLSRGAIIAFVFSLPLLLWASKNGAKFRTHLPRLLLVLATAYMVAKLIPMPPEQRANIEELIIAPTQQAENDQAIRQRLLLWQSTWKMIGESNILVGSGIGTFITHYPAYRDPQDRTLGNHAHNDYLQALFEGGIIQLFFFVALTIFTPLWLLYKIVSTDRHSNSDQRDITPGLLIGIFCIAVHALVNFVHFVVPIALLTGLYLARAWERLHPRRSFCLLPKHGGLVKPHFVKALSVVVLTVPVVVLAADGIIFKLFSSDGALASRLNPQQRISVLNTAIALRPGNPMPRLTLIRHLLDVAEKSEPEIRDKLLRWAQNETRIVEPIAPGTALVQFFLGKILMLKGSHSDLLAAQVHMESAVKRAPHSTMMRADLIRIYRQLGWDTEAYKVVNDAKQWLRFETSMSSLAAFAREAQLIAQHQKNVREAQYWSQIEIEAENLAKKTRAAQLCLPLSCFQRYFVG